MKGKMSPNVSEMFDQAVESFDTALRTGVKIQEEATRWWSGMLLETDSLEEMQQRMRIIMNDTIPLTRRNIEQYMMIFDRTYRSSMEMLKKAFEMSQSDSIATAQVKTQELWEASLAMMRNNAQMIVQLNSRAMEMWAEFTRKDLAGQTMHATATATSRAAEAAQSAMGAAQRATNKAMDAAMDETERMSKRTAAAQRTASARRTAGGGRRAAEKRTGRSPKK